MKFSNSVIAQLLFVSGSTAFVVKAPTAAVPASSLNMSLDWDKLKSAPRMKPLPGSTGPGFQNAANGAATMDRPAPAAPATNGASYSYGSAPAAPATNGSSVSSGSVWASLSASKPMKPLPGSSGPGFKAATSVGGYTPAAAAPASDDTVFSFSSSTPVTGNVWDMLKQSKPMKPIPGSTGSGFKTSPPVNGASAAPSSGASFESFSGLGEGASVASGSPWASLASSKPMKPLPGSSGAGFKASAPVNGASASSSSVSSGAPVATGNVWDVLKQSKQMKPLPGTSGPGFKTTATPGTPGANTFVATLGGTSSVSIGEKQALVNDAFAGMMKDIKSLQQDMKIQVEAIDELRDGIAALEILVNDLQETLEAVLDERDDLRRQLAAAKAELERLYARA